LVTPSRYRSLEALAKIMRLHDAETVRRQASEAGMTEVSTWEVQVPSGKRLEVLLFR
jgi:hypothetical protein